MKYVVISEFGNVHHFNSDDELVYHFWTTFFYGEAARDKIRIYDAYSRQPLSFEYFLNNFYKKLDLRRKEVAERRLGPYTFRKDPIKGTGRRSWSGCMRHPKTKQELSQEFPTRAKRKYTFRRGPVPLIRCSRGGNGSYRSPKTKQEKTQEIPTRLSRRSIPTSWDDVYRDTQRCWKKYRRTQWK